MKWGEVEGWIHVPPMHVSGVSFSQMTKWWNGGSRFIFTHVVACSSVYGYAKARDMYLWMEAGAAASCVEAMSWMW